MRSIIYTATAARALRRHASRAASIRSKLEQYAVDPASLANNVKKLKGVDAKRLRIGDFRVILQETEAQIVILDIGPRSAIYE